MDDGGHPLVPRGGPADDPRLGAVGVDDLRLEPATRRAWRGAVELALSAKEFALLELFLRHPDEVLTRTRILEHIWDIHFDPQTNVVDVLVLRLRGKIDRGGEVKLIHTLRGIGYVLRAD